MLTNATSQPQTSSPTGGIMFSPRVEGGYVMKGSVRTKQVCPVCAGKFTLQIVSGRPGLFCEKGCRTTPTRYYVDCRMFKRLVPRGAPKQKAVGYLSRDEMGRYLDSYFRAEGLRESVEYDYNKDPTKFQSSKWSTIGQQSRKFREIWADWHKIVERSGHRGYGSNVEMFGRIHVLPVIGDKPLGKGDLMELTASDLQNLEFALKDKGLAAGTRINVMGYIKSALHFAKDEKIIGTDDIPKFPKIKREKQTVYHTVRAVHEEIKKHLPDGTHLFVDILSETGCRICEAVGIKRCDLMPDGRLHIQRSIDKYYKEGTPKNGESRKVSISQNLWDKLNALPVIGDAYLFHTRYGKPYTTNIFHKLFTHAAKKAGYPQLKPYSCFRHSMASTIAQEFQEKGVAAASAALGNTAGVAERHYIHGEETLVQPWDRLRSESNNPID